MRGIAQCVTLLLTGFIVTVHARLPICPPNEGLCYNAWGVGRLNELRASAGSKKLTLGSLAMTRDALNHSEAMRARGKTIYTKLEDINKSGKYKCGEFVVAELVTVARKKTNVGPADACIRRWSTSENHLRVLTLPRLDNAALGVKVGVNWVWCTLILSVNTRHSCPKPMWPPPSQSPSPTPTISVTPSMTASPSSTMTATATATASATASPTISYSATPSVSMSMTPSASASKEAQLMAQAISVDSATNKDVAPTVTPTVSVTASPSMKSEPKASANSSMTASPSAAPQILAQSMPGSGSSTFNGGQLGIPGLQFSRPDTAAQVVDAATYKFQYGRVNIKYPDGKVEATSLQCFGGVCRYCVEGGTYCYSASFSMLVDLYLKEQRSQKA